MGPVTPDLASLVRRLETAQASQSRSFLRAAQAEHPDLSVRALRGRWGFAHFFTEGHFLNQALALGLAAPVSPRQLDRIEGLLAQGGHPVVLELAPTADPALGEMLADRGYRIQAFQQVLAVPPMACPPLPAMAWDPRVRIHRIQPEEIGLWHQVVQAGFMDRDALASGADMALGFSARAEGNHFFLAMVDTEPAGAGVLGCFRGVGVCSGTSVLPRHRGLGIQRALAATRLALARESGCRWVCAAVLPGTASQANLERCGFRVAYPKVEMVRG